MSASVRRRAARTLGFGVFALLASFIAVPPAGAVPSVSFAAVVNYVTGGSGAGWSETTAVTADFNNDGRPDVASTDYFSTRAPLVQLNLGNGVFQSPGIRLPSSANGAGALAAGDVNTDGKVDLLLSNTAQILVFKGNGNGTFTAGATYNVFTGGQEDIVIFDVNNDGKKDAVTVTRYGFQVMIGNGNGTFTLPAPQIVPSIFPSAVDDARFNNDANPDLLLIDGAGQVIPMLGNGNGTFTQGAQGYGGLILATGLAADFNHDGIDDAVALPEFNAGVRNAVVFISNGSGGFTGTGTYYDCGYAPVSGDIADLNRDGNPDVACSDTIGNKAVILLGNGNGTFTQGGSFAVSTSPQTPVVADFNLDGRIDIAAIGLNSSFQGVLSVLRNIP